jgi:hypothetical protein
VHAEYDPPSSEHWNVDPLWSALKPNDAEAEDWVEPLPGPDVIEAVGGVALVWMTSWGAVAEPASRES